jgi:hypothetical protein
MDDRAVGRKAGRRRRLAVDVGAEDERLDDAVRGRDDRRSAGAGVRAAASAAAGDEEGEQEREREERDPFHFLGLL